MSFSSHEPIYSGPVCPPPLVHDKKVVLGHGSGGRMTQRLIQKFFKPYFENEFLLQGNDFASLPVPPELGTNARLVTSADAHIVSPLFFPGGDIGRLAVCGTVNDISMSGAIPRYLTATFILEEGLDTAILEKIAHSMQIAAREAGIDIVAADTKVAEKNKVDQIFISTTGIGWKPEGRDIGGEKAKPGDVILLSGTLGDHGVAILTARGNLGLENGIQSDVAPLTNLVQKILLAAPHTHVLRDPTRGGLATTLNEIAQQSNCCIRLDETQIPVRPAVKSTCEMLGLDPLYIANEGKVIVIVPEDEASQAFSAMQSHPLGKNARQIGRVMDNSSNHVLLNTWIGGTRVLEMLSGEILPRIC